MCGLRLGIPAAFASPTAASVSANDGATGSRQSAPADYRENQARAQRAWAQDHREYWREYRRTHPQCSERSIARLPGGGSVSAGGAPLRWTARGLQRWTRRRRIRRCLQAPIGVALALVRSEIAIVQY